MTASTLCARNLPQHFNGCTCVRRDGAGEAAGITLEVDPHLDEGHPWMDTGHRQLPGDPDDHFAAMNDDELAATVHDELLIRGKDKQAQRAWLDQVRSRRNSLIMELDGNDDLALRFDRALAESVTSWRAHKEDRGNDPLDSDAEVVAAWRDSLREHEFFGHQPLLATIFASERAMDATRNDPEITKRLLRIASGRGSRMFEAADGTSISIDGAVRLAAQSGNPEVRAVVAAHATRGSELSHYLAHDPNDDVRAAVARQSMSSMSYKKQGPFADDYSLGAAPKHTGALIVSKDEVKRAYEVEEVLREDPSNEVRAALAMNSRWVSGKTGDILLSDPSPRVRAAALRSAAHSANGVKRFAYALSHKVKDEDPMVRATAAEVLPRFRSHISESKMKKMVNALADDPDVLVRDRVKLAPAAPGVDPTALPKVRRRR